MLGGNLVNTVKQPAKQFDSCYTQCRDAVSSHREENGTSGGKFIPLILRQDEPRSPWAICLSTDHRGSPEKPIEIRSLNCCAKRKYLVTGGLLQMFVAG